MGNKLCSPRLLLYGVILPVALCLAVACGRGVSQQPAVSPLSPSPEATTVPLVSSPGLPASGDVYAAQIRAAWASGYPYPVFFFDVPYGTASVVLREVVYGPGEPLGGTHPRLERVVQAVVWPDTRILDLVAENFYYDEVQGMLLTYEAALDGVPLETASRDVFSTKGVGVAYLGDTGGVNVFYNCASPTSIDYRELATDEDGRPTEGDFGWECEGDSYEVSVEVTWGTSGPRSNIDVITGLTATITRW